MLQLISSTPGLKLSREVKKVRALQLNFDLIRPNGLFVNLVRGVVTEDYEKYPEGRCFSHHLGRGQRRLENRQRVDMGKPQPRHVGPPSIGIAASAISAIPSAS